MKNAYSNNLEFLEQYDRNSNYVVNSIPADNNRKIFIQRCYDVINESSRLEDIQLTRIVVEKYIKLAKTRKNGWFKFEKDMSLLAYNVAMDVIESVIKRRGL